MGYIPQVTDKWLLSLEKGQKFTDCTLSDVAPAPKMNEHPFIPPGLVLVGGDPAGRVSYGH